MSNGNGNNHVYVVRARDSAVFYHVGMGFSVAEASLLDYDEAKQVIANLQKAVSVHAIRFWKMVEVF